MDVLFFQNFVIIFVFTLKGKLLSFRASRPQLTMYITPEWHQSDTGMREYHAMFLEQLTVEDLKKKLAKKCCIEESNIVTVLKYEIP